MTRLCRTEKISQAARTQISKNLSKRETLSSRQNCQSECFVENRLCFKWRKNMANNVGSYTQGRIAGDFLSSRKAAWAERYPPKTTAAALDG